MIPGNPMGQESQYVSTPKKSLNQEHAIRKEFSQSLLDAFITRDEEFDQFRQNEEKEYDDDFEEIQ